MCIGGRCTDDLFIGFEKGGIITESHLFGGRSGGASLTDQGVGGGNPFVDQIVFHRCAGGLFEQMVQIVFAEEEVFAERIKGNGCRKIPVQIIHDPFNGTALRLCAGRASLQLHPQDLRQQCLQANGDDLFAQWFFQMGTFHQRPEIVLKRIGVDGFKIDIRITFSAEHGKKKRTACIAQKACMKMKRITLIILGTFDLDTVESARSKQQNAVGLRLIALSLHKITDMAAHKIIDLILGMTVQRERIGRLVGDRIMETDIVPLDIFAHFFIPFPLYCV